MSYTPNNPNGQAANADSSPVTLSTEQDAKLDSIDGNLGSINSSTSELPFHTTLLDAISGKLDDIKGYTDQIESGISATNTVLTDGTQKALIHLKTATGNITTANLVPAGVATAGSAVECNCDGYTGGVVQLTGTHTGPISLQYTIDGATWVTGLSCFYSIVSTSTPSSTISSATNGIFRFPTFGAKKIRITGLSAMTGTTVVTIIVGVNTGYVEGGFITSIINAVGISSTTGAAYLAKAEDAPANSGDPGIATWSVRRDALTVSASATGDYNERASTKYGSQFVKQEERQKLTYSYSCELTPAASGTDFLEILPSSSKAIHVQQIEIYAFATAATFQQVNLLRRSTLNSGGTRTAVTAIKHEQADAAATGSVNYYTANPTTGTLVGKIKAIPLYFAPVAGTAKIDAVVLQFGDRHKPLILPPNSTESFVLNLRSSTPSGAIIVVNITLTEE